MHRTALLAVLLLSLGGWAQYPPANAPGTPAVVPPTTLSGTFVCLLRTLDDVRTAKQFEFLPVLIPESAAGAMKFLVRPNGTWVDISRGLSPAAVSKYIYKDGVARFVSLRGELLYIFSWGRDSKGAEYLVETPAAGGRGQVCRKVR